MPMVQKQVFTTAQAEERASTESRKGGSKTATYTYQVLPGNESVLMREALQRRSWWREAKKDKQGSCQWNLWYGSNGQSFDFSQLIGSSQGLRIANRIENHREVCTKSGLANTLSRIQTALRSGPLPWVPETYVLPGRAAQTDSNAWARFCRRYKEVSDQGGGTTWIVKPISLNRGNGIEVFNQLELIQAHLALKKPDSKWVVQRYIEDPALVDGRKFDIRAYVLVTPDKSVYMCKEAYVRTSSTPYNLKDLSDKSAHLTNDAVQKHLDSYHKYEDHCKMDMIALQTMLPGIDIQGRVFPAMRECVRHVFGMALPTMNPRRLSLCWELLGLDFMIDSKGQVYLIEVNTSPALFRAGAYLADLLPRVVEECVQKAIDPYFPPPAGTPTDQLPTPLDAFERLEPLTFTTPSTNNRDSSVSPVPGATRPPRMSDVGTTRGRMSDMGEGRSSAGSRVLRSLGSDRGPAGSTNTSSISGRLSTNASMKDRSVGTDRGPGSTSLSARGSLSTSTSGKALIPSTRTSISSPFSTSTGTKGAVPTTTSSNSRTVLSSSVGSKNTKESEGAEGAEAVQVGAQRRALGAGQRSQSLQLRTSLTTWK